MNTGTIRKVPKKLLRNRVFKQIIQPEGGDRD